VATLARNGGLIEATASPEVDAWSICPLPRMNPVEAEFIWGRFSLSRYHGTRFNTIEVAKMNRFGVPPYVVLIKWSILGTGGTGIVCLMKIKAYYNCPDLV